VDFPFEEYRTLLIAPTGWGKTSLILNLLRKTDRKFVFLSPLRALADEFFKRVQSEGHKNFMPESRKKLKEGIDEYDYKILILTYELIDEISLGQILDKDYYFIVDEVHLNLMWGNDFRPQLLELLDILFHFQKRLLLLTATCSDDLLKYIDGKKSETFIINLKNYEIKKTPRTIYHGINKKNLLSQLPSLQKGTTLVFCKYRNEVKHLEKIYLNKGYKVISCVSGEVDYFRRILKKEKQLDFIFATSTLSHGVNLPKLSAIFILYPVPNKELWIQMIGRGGRRGEEFKVYQLNYYNYKKKLFIIGMIQWYILEKFLNIRKIFAIRRYFSP
jgi:ATP-dependent DNA helicase RecQ